MTSSTLRTTKCLFEYLDVLDEIQIKAVAMKVLVAREVSLRSQVIESIGETGRRAVKHGDAVRLLRTVDKESFGLAVDEQTAVEFCQSMGLAIDSRSAEWLSPAKRRKYGQERLVPESIISRSVEQTIAVD